MGKRYTVIPKNTFDTLQFDAGVLLKNFDIEAASAATSNPGFTDADLICATSGGINASCVPTYSDFGADVDNVPVNMMEFKHLDSWECKLSTTGLGTSPELIRMALGAADIDIANASKIDPRSALKLTDFTDCWWVGDKANGGFVAIHLTNGLATSGFSLQTTKNGKGTVGLEITGHVSIEDQEKVPMTFYSIDPTLDEVSVAPEAGNVVLFDTLVSDMQSNVVVKGGKITGTLKYFPDGIAAAGPLSGAGNFLALKFANIDAKATSCMVGLDPSQGTGLVEIINDPDKNGVFKITANTQKFKVVSTDGTDTTTQIYDLTDLVLEGAD